jgi:KUP system potassium uptake protein
MSTAMVVWTVGRSNLADYDTRRSIAWDVFVKDLHIDQVARPPVIGVFMASDARGVPPMMVHLAERIGSIPEIALLFTVRFEHVPWIDRKKQLVEIVDLGHGFHRVVVRYGFMQQPNVPELLGEVFRKLKLPRLLEEATYYLGRETFIGGKAGRMGNVMEGLFKLMSRNAMPATAYFQLPTEQVVEIGMQIDL